MKLKEARTARDEQRWPDATSLLSTVRALLNNTDEAVSAAGDRLRRLNAVSKDPRQEIDRTRFAIRDAQRLAMSGRNTPDPRHARPLDESVARLERAITTLEGRHPDYWHFLTETEAVRQTVGRVVSQIRGRSGAAGPEHHTYAWYHVRPRGWRSGYPGRMLKVRTASAKCVSVRRRRTWPHTYFAREPGGASTSTSTCPSITVSAPSTGSARA